VFISVYRMELQSVMLLFLTQLCAALPLSPSFWFTPPPPHLPCVKVQYIQTVCGWEGVGALSPVRDHILQKFNTQYLTKFTPNKNLGEEGASDR
jgi:hypothetical protein